MKPMTIKYYINGEARVAYPTTNDDMLLLMGIIERAEGYVIEAYVTPDTNPGELPEYSEITPYR